MSRVVRLGDLPANTLAMRVSDRSMTNRGIELGDWCYVVPDRPLDEATDVVIARAWTPDGSEIGLVVKVLGEGGRALYDDGDAGLEPFHASRFEVLGPVVAVQAPSRRPLTAYERAIAAIEALSPDALAEITPADIQGAKALWDRYASPAMRGLLDARPEEPRKPNQRAD